MRKGKKFTSRLIRRWEKEGRSQGIGDAYSGWHQVTRSDPASRGRSHWVPSDLSGRLFHHLSDGEKAVNLLVRQLGQVHDVLENLALERDTHSAFLRRFDLRIEQASLPGTIEISKTLGLRHPTLYSKKDGNEIWKLTTDVVAVIRLDSDHLKVFPISSKREALTKKRDKQLADIEQEYWRVEAHPWQMFIYEEMPLHIRLNLQSLAPWILLPPLETASVLDQAAQIIGISSFRIVDAVESIAAGMNVPADRAQKILWKAVWAGKIPIQIRQDLFRGKNILRATLEEFRAANPLLRASGK